MPILIFLRQYGWREYAVTLAVAVLVGLGIAALLNAAAGGGAGAPAMLKPANQVAKGTPRVLTTRVYKPVSAAKATPKRHRARPHHRRVHRAATAPAPRLVSAPVATPAPRPRVSRPRPTPAPAAAPVVRRPAPAPKPQPAPAPKRSGGGGSVQFDDSG